MVYPFPLELLKSIKHLHSLRNAFTFCRLRHGGFTLLSYKRMQKLFCLANEAASIDGDIVECGCYNGGSGAILALASQKKTWLFDSFEGLPPPTKEDGEWTMHQYYVGWDKGSIEKVSVAFSLLGVPRNQYVCVKGWFQETLPNASVEKIALLHVDADWYDSVRLVLSRFYQNVQPGGFVVIDDYGHWEGCRKAVDEFLASVDENIRLIRIDEDGVYFQKPLTSNLLA